MTNFDGSAPRYHLTKIALLTPPYLLTNGNIKWKLLVDLHMFYYLGLTI